MHRWLYFFVTFCGLALLLFAGFRLLPVSSAIANVGCSAPLTKTALAQPLNTDPSGGCPDDPSQDTAIPSLKQPAPKSERYFFTDTGYQLDQYLFRNDVITTSGRLTFAIDIDRYYSPLITTTALITDGLVDRTVITNLINSNLLPPTAMLTLEVYDIDNGATGCAEVDHIYLNNQLLLDPFASFPRSGVGIPSRRSSVPPPNRTTHRIHTHKTPPTLQLAQKSRAFATTLRVD